MAESRTSIMERFRKKVATGLPIIGGGAGTGISAKCEEAGGIDLIIIYNSGRFRMAGRGSLAGLMPYGNANVIVKEMAHEVLTAVNHTPVLAGVCATDPFMIRDLFLRELKDMGFAGIQNFPTVGLIDGTMRINLEETGMGFEHEIDLIAAAHELDLLTTPYAFDPEQARLLAQRRRGHHCGSHGPDHEGLDWRQDRQDARRLRGRSETHCGGRQGRSTRCACPLPWWTNRFAGRCAIHPGEYPR